MARSVRHRSRDERPHRFSPGARNRFIESYVGSMPRAGGEPALHTWLRRVHAGIVNTNRDYPFMAYGTDWLAFGHLVIVIAFFGPMRDPCATSGCSFLV